MIQRPRYSGTEQAEFSRTLKERVNGYFQTLDIDTSAGNSMIWKSLILFGTYVGIYLLIMLGGISNLPTLFFLWALLGLGQSFVGMSIMHDAVHDAYTKNRFAYYLLQIPIVAIGVEPKIWRIEHNLLHHTYPNVEGIDQDIHPRRVFRFTENQPKKWFHVYQHVYATFFYGLLIIEWLTVKDFLKVIKYRKMGFFKTNSQSVFIALLILLKKLVFFFIFLYLPLKFLPFDPLVTFAMFITMLVVAGISMTIVFQLAHVVSHCDSESDSLKLEEKNWHVYQLETTCNFAHGNKVVSYLIGGLNYQVEHHLFPHICHTHYPALSVIVKQTACEFDVPYNYENTFWGAIKSHYKHLKELGNSD